MPSKSPANPVLSWSSLGYDLDPGWKMDPLLEISVDAGGGSAAVRLDGRLDGATGASVRSVVAELLEQGHRDIVIDIERLEVPPAGFAILVGIQRLVRGAEGTLTCADRTSAGTPGARAGSLRSTAPSHSTTGSGYVEARNWHLQALLDLDPGRSMRPGSEQSS